MNAAQIAGLVLIAGFVFVLVASVTGPPGLYKEPDVDRLLELVAAHSASWAASNLFFGLAALLTAAGLSLFSLHVWGTVNPWPAGVGTAAYILGALAYAVFLYRRTVDPAALFGDYTFSPLAAILLASLVIGLLLYGVVILRAGYPGWLGWGFIAGTLVIGGGRVFRPGVFSGQQATGGRRGQPCKGEGDPVGVGRGQGRCQRSDLEARPVVGPLAGGVSGM
jgi:hypothetical protein